MQVKKGIRSNRKAEHLNEVKALLKNLTIDLWQFWDLNSQTSGNISLALVLTINYSKQINALESTLL